MKSPLLILVSGAAGVGKSTLSISLAEKLKATLLDKDAVDECFSPGKRGPYYTARIEPKIIQALLNLTELNLRPGSTVIIDLPWSHILLNSPFWIPRIKGVIKKKKAKLKILECVLEETLHQQRMRNRGFKRDQFRLSKKGWEVFRRTDRLGELNPLPHQVLQMNQPRSKCVADALKALRAK